MSVAAYVIKIVPIYQSAASVVFEMNEPRILNDLQDVMPQTNTGYNNREFYETEFRILQSRMMLERVVRRLGLDKDPEFLGLKELAEKGTAEALQAAIESARPADILRLKLKIAPIRDSRVFLIQYLDTDPMRAMQYANAHAQAYVEYNLERRMDGVRTATKWLNEQLGDLKDKVEFSELALYEFKKEHNVLAQTLDERNDLLKKDIEQTSSQLVDTRSRLLSVKISMEEIAKARKNPDIMELLPEVYKSSEYQAYKSLQVNLVGQLSMLTQKYGDKHPKVVEVVGQLDTLKQRYQKTYEDIFNGIESEYKMLLSTERELQKHLQAISSESLEINKNAIEFNKLKRENDNNNRLYGLVMGRLKETDLTGLIRSNSIRIIDQAELPLGPVYPQVDKMLMIAAFVGLIAGVGLAVILDFLDNTVKSHEELQKDFGLTFLGFIPDYSRVAQTQGKKQQLILKNRDLYVYENQRSQVAECARAIRTNIMFMGTDHPIRKILVASAKPEEGKTSIAIHLATVTALSGSRTILVDTDMRRPRLHRVFGMGSEIGISNYLLGEKKLTEITQKTMIENLDVLTCGPIPPSPAELLHSEKFKTMVEELGRMYDRVIFDSPPIVAVSDSAILSSLVDGVVLVVKSGRTPKEMLREAVIQLHSANARILGALMNSIDLQSRSYGYYYGYYYRQYGLYSQDTKAVSSS